MTKKKYLWSLLAFLMVAALSFGLASCSDDDDDDAPAYVGDWSFTSSTDFSDRTVDLKLTKDGKFVYLITNNIKELPFSSKSYPERRIYRTRVTGEYTVKGNTMTLNPTKGEFYNEEESKWENQPNFEPYAVDVQFKVEGNTMTFESSQMSDEPMVFTKK